MKGIDKYQIAIDAKNKAYLDILARYPVFEIAAFDKTECDTQFIILHKPGRIDQNLTFPYWIPIPANEKAPEYAEAGTICMP